MKHNIFRLIKGEHGTFSGIFIIIDGELFINHLENLDVALHMDLFAEMLRIYPDLKKYQAYQYYMFPRGSVVSSNSSNWILLNAPIEFSKHQVSLLIKMFGQSKKEIEVIDGEHYSLNFIRSQIRSNSWPAEIIEEEVRFAESFYKKQIELF